MLCLMFLGATAEYGATLSAAFKEQGITGWDLLLMRFKDEFIVFQCDINKWPGILQFHLIAK